MKFTFFVLACICLSVHILGIEAFNERPYSRPKQHRKILNILADKFIEFFDLENKLIADNYFAKSNSDENFKCENVNNITDYFWEVYSKNESKKLTAEDLENIISYQINKRYRDRETKERSDQNKCKRRKVYFSDYFLFHFPN